MLIAKINEPVPVDYREAFPNVSFPAAGPEDEFLAANGYAKVNLFKDHDRATQKLVNVAPYYEAPWVYTVAVEPKTQADIDAEIEAQWAVVRADRNKRLYACDWTQLPDAPVDSAVWASYRQALRDVTNQADPFAIVWPVSPDAPVILQEPVAVE